MAGCITSDYKTILVGLVVQDTAKEMLQAIIGTIPICPEVSVAAKAAVKEATRKAPEPWGIEPVYYNEKGKKETFSSPSALVKALGLPMSGIQCDTEGKKCRAMSAIDILRIQGYTVSGNGEPRKAAEGGKVLKVYHPDAPQLKKEK